MSRYGWAIDLSSCIACHACDVACKSNNNLPNGIWWNRVVTDGGAYMDTARGMYPDALERCSYPVNCQHCSNPACVAVCPTGASYVREDGLVAIDAEQCIGCQVCMDACPYGARTMMTEVPEYYSEFPLGDSDAPLHMGGVATKCTGCSHRMDRGDGSVPACMELCPGRARHWGDLDDPESDICRFLEGKDWFRLYEEAGTEPNVYYVR